MKLGKSYTVSEVSKLAGVSVKTLHHYDVKGVLVPYRQQNNGYRVYTQSHLVQLQQILIYRELGFSIEKIKPLLYSEGCELLDTLSQQKQLLIQRQQSLSKMINSIEVTMDSIKGKENFDILFEDIPKEKAKRWDELARERVGYEDTDKRMVAFSKLSEQQVREFKEESDKVTQAFAQTIGQPYDSELVQQLTDRHYHMTNNFSKLVASLNGVEKASDINYEVYVKMANSVDNAEMHELCEHYGEGYAEHSRQAMIYYAEQQLQKKMVEEK